MEDKTITQFLEDEGIKTKFKPQLILFAEKEYKEALELSRQRLKVLMEGVEWCARHVSINDIETFSKDMETFFLDRLADTKPEIKKLGIKNPLKIANLLDLDLPQLRNIQNRFETNEGRIIFKDGQVKEDVDPETFKVYTKDEQQNTEKYYADKVIQALEDAEAVASINKRLIRQATGGLVYWNPYDGGKLVWNHHKV